MESRVALFSLALFSLFSLGEQELMHSKGIYHRSYERNAEFLRNYRRFKNDGLNNERCGITNAASSRVVSGHDATFGEWPWQAQINLIQPDGQLEFFCGGSLIDSQWVLTAAHCIVDDDSTKYVVMIGGIDRTKIEKSEQSFRVTKIIKHRLYNIDSPYTHDIALLHLSHKARVTPFVNTVCLPREGQQEPEGKECYISGWGNTEHQGDAPDILQQAAMPVVTNDACKKKLDTSPNGGLRVDNRTWIVTDEMLCAGDAGKTEKNGCFGDSGGPFTCKDEKTGRWILQGVVSWGDPDCSSSSHYTVFTRVSSFIGWITTQEEMYEY